MQDNSYVETVEYVSLAGKKDKSGSDYSLKGGLAPTRGEYNIETQEPAGASNGQNVITAVFKLVAIIVFCLISANILVTLLIPVIEITVPEELTHTVMFVTFFALFLLLAVPLVLRRSFLTRPTPLSRTITLMTAMNRHWRPLFPRRLLNSSAVL